MDLLVKFADVKIKGDTRITETDKDFCKAHQAAYDSARSELSELKFFWEDMLDNQRTLLSSTGESPTLYLSSGSEINISPDRIDEQIKAVHRTFICQLVEHFNRTYSISISVNDVINALMPEQPKASRHYDETDDWKVYEKEVLELSLQYTDILEQIFVLLDGRSLKEKAMHELLEKCHQAAWEPYNKAPRYALKKAVLQFSNYACSYNDRYSYGSWELSEKIKRIFQGIAHYETDSFGMIPSEISSVISSYYIRNDYYEFPSCKRVQSIRLYKNGRVDIRFATEEYARKFTEKYLGTAY